MDPFILLLCKPSANSLPRFPIKSSIGPSSPLFCYCNFKLPIEHGMGPVSWFPLKPRTVSSERFPIEIGMLLYSILSRMIYRYILRILFIEVILSFALQSIPASLQQSVVKRLGNISFPTVHSLLASVGTATTASKVATTPALLGKSFAQECMVLFSPNTSAFHRSCRYQ